MQINVLYDPLTLDRSFRRILLNAPANQFRLHVPNPGASPSVHDAGVHGLRAQIPVRGGGGCRFAGTVTIRVTGDYQSKP